tara:strand:+ start:3483 stop:4292 length:810 start_codon:yes stop_codon:yes gene_type:complete
MLTGAHGVGKTTTREALVPLIESAYDPVLMIDEVSRTLIVEMGLTSPKQLRGDQIWEFQNRIITQQIDKEVEMLDRLHKARAAQQQPVVLSDRSIFCYMAYARLYGPRQKASGFQEYLNHERRELSRWSRAVLERVKTLGIRYRIVQVQPLMYTKIRDDGVRGTNVRDQQMVDVLIADLIQAPFRGSKALALPADKFIEMNSLLEQIPEQASLGEIQFACRTMINDTLSAGKIAMLEIPNNKIAPTQFLLRENTIKQRARMLHALMRNP